MQAELASQRGRSASQSSRDERTLQNHLPATDAPRALGVVFGDIDTSSLYRSRRSSTPVIRSRSQLRPRVWRPLADLSSVTIIATLVRLQRTSR
jgi:hypothetical protein